MKLKEEIKVLVVLENNLYINYLYIKVKNV